MFNLYLQKLFMNQLRKIFFVEQIAEAAIRGVL